MNTTSKEGSLFELDGVPKIEPGISSGITARCGNDRRLRYTCHHHFSGAAGLETADRVLFADTGIFSCICTCYSPAALPNRKRLGFI